MRKIRVHLRFIIIESDPSVPDPQGATNVSPRAVQKKKKKPKKLYTRSFKRAHTSESLSVIHGFSPSQVHAP